MAFKRKATKRPVRRMVAKKRRVMRRVPRAPTNKIVMKRTLFDQTWQFNTTTTGGFWRYWTFNTGTFNNFGEFAAVFDEYKFNAIKVTFRPNFDNIDITAAATKPECYAHICIDPASVLSPSGLYSQANVNAFLEQSTVKTYKTSRPFSVYFKPRIMDTVTGGTAGGARAIKSGYLRTDQTTVAHRGFHMFLQQNALATGNDIRLDVFITIYASFRNLR